MPTQRHKVQQLCDELNDLEGRAQWAHRRLQDNVQPQGSEDRCFKEQGLNLLKMARNAIEEARVWIQDIGRNNSHGEKEKGIRFTEVRQDESTGGTAEGREGGPSERQLPPVDERRSQRRGAERRTGNATASPRDKRN